jgi:predicted MPP superfamily phosphohydrolase
VKRRLEVAALAVLALALPLGLWAFWIEPASLRVVEEELFPRSWPGPLAGTRVALIADLHVGSPFNGLGKLERVVELTNEAAPDLVLLAGDFVIRGVLGGHFVTPEAVAEVLARLDVPLGTWAVLGNHDWWYDAARVRSALEAVGIPILEDAAARIDTGAGPLWIVGVGDHWEGAHDSRAALARVPAGEPVILFTHNPDVFPELPRPVNVALAGHTHGGQVYIPLVGRPIVPSLYGERYARGRVVEDGNELFVTSGVGTSILPVRFLVPPEIAVVTLR